MSHRRRTWPPGAVITVPPSIPVAPCCQHRLRPYSGWRSSQTASTQPVRRLRRVQASRPPIQSTEMLSGRRLADAQLVRCRRDGAGPDVGAQDLELPSRRPLAGRGGCCHTASAYQSSVVAVGGSSPLATGPSAPPSVDEPWDEVDPEQQAEQEPERGVRDQEEQVHASTPAGARRPGRWGCRPGPTRGEEGRTCMHALRSTGWSGGRQARGRTDVREAEQKEDALTANRRPERRLA
jgi:hypothetical protein